MYMLENRKVFFPANVIATLKEWNSNPEKANAEYDCRVVKAVLLLCVKPVDILQHNISDDVKEFIHGMYVMLKQNTRF